MTCTLETAPDRRTDTLVATPWPTAPGLLWYVLHTKSRQEKALADALDTLSVTYFLPLHRQLRHYGNRKAQVDLPLFPGYLFLRGTLDQVYQADRTRRVANILHVKDQQRLTEELTAIHVALTHAGKLDPYPYLTRNTKVQVKSGPLRGLRGVIENRTRLDRLILQVEVLGQAVSLEIDGSLLEVIE